MQLLKFLFRLAPGRIAAVMLAGLVSGLANTYLLVVISRVLAPAEVGTTWQRFAITAALALSAAVAAQVMLIRLTQDAIFRLRAELSARVTSAPLEQLERLGTHRLLATLTEDVRSLSQSVSAIPTVCVDVVTVIGCLVFLAVISGPVFAVTVAGTLAGIFGVELALRRVRRTYRAARENEDRLLGSFQAVTAGIKELKLHRDRRIDFMNRHLLGAAADLREQNVAASVRFCFADAYGRVLQLLTMGAVLFGIATLLGLSRSVMISYMLVTMFLAGPMQSFMQRIPDLLRGDVALAKINALNLSIGGAPTEPTHDVPPPAPATARLQVRGLNYTYAGEPPPRMPGPPPGGPGGPPGMGGGGKGFVPPPMGPPPMEPGFHLGPLDLDFAPGQLTFIVGGNGSGKSTLVKLLCGLYRPHSGSVRLNGVEIGPQNVEWLRQSCSAVFTDFHLFDEYLGFDAGVDQQVRELLEKLQIAHKVTVHHGRLSTTALSQGQRKRLALLTALLEDRPIYLFDEWAADQEPRFRDVFYTQIVPELAARGKTVIVITHDDRYFHHADQLIKLDFGGVQDVSGQPTAAKPSLATLAT